MSRDGEIEGALLVVEGKSYAWVRMWLGYLAVLWALGACGVLALQPHLERAASGWTSGSFTRTQTRTERFAAGVARVMIPLYFFAGGPFFLIARAYMRTKAKRVEIHREGVFVFPNTSSLKKWERAWSVSWRDLQGYRDGFSGSVRLVRRGRIGRWWDPDLVIPTPTEEKRLQVLEIFDTFKLSRLE